MKQIFTILSVALIMVSCRNTPQQSINGQASMISAEQAKDFAAFQEWQQQKELAAAQNTVLASKEAKPTIIYVTQPKTVTRVIERQPAPVVQNAPAAETAEQPVQKKKWSKAAKGAVIGAGTGAVAGAIIGKKNRVLGAVIGGVAGAGVGFGIGKVLDKKDGR